MQLQLPTLQNWSCHNCGGCCRQHAVEVTDEERERIERQNWPADPSLDWSGPLFEILGGPFWNRRYRLAQREDGACVFLDEHGLCRIHGKFDENAKPLACRVYPYAFHPAGKKVAVSLRFSCPSVVADRGKAMAEQSRSIKHIANAVVPPGHAKTPPPLVHPAGRVEWNDLLKIVSTIDSGLADDSRPALHRVLQTLAWVDLLGETKFEKIQGSRLDELLQLIVSAADLQAAQTLQEDLKPLGALSQTQFRLRLAMYCRKDVAGQAPGWGDRWKLLQAASRFAAGVGMTPEIHPELPPVPFNLLAESEHGLPEESWPMLLRFLRVQVQGLHFCGPAFYDVPLVEGLRSLVLTLPIAAVVARWHALAQGRDQSTPDDVAKAVEIIGHNHGYSEGLATGSARRTVKLLSDAEGITSLLRLHCEGAAPIPNDVTIEKQRR